MKGLSHWDEPTTVSRDYNSVFLYSILHRNTEAVTPEPAAVSAQLQMTLCCNVEQYDAFIDLWDSLSVTDMML